jgi:hypothetical protein
VEQNDRLTHVEARVESLCRWRDDQRDTTQRIFDKLDEIVQDLAERPPAWMVPVVGVLTTIIGVLAGALWSLR